MVFGGFWWWYAYVIQHFLWFQRHDSNLGSSPASSTCKSSRNWRTPWPLHCRVRANAGAVFWGIRFLMLKSWKNLLKWKDDPWEKASIFWVSPFRSGTKIWNRNNSCSSLQHFENLAMVKCVLSSHERQPRQGSGEEKPAHSVGPWVEKPVCFTRSCSFFFPEKYCTVKSDQDCSRLVEGSLKENHHFCFLSWRHPKEIDTLSFFLANVRFQDL